jgi:hypothetical protein
MATTSFTPVRNEADLDGGELLDTKLEHAIKMLRANFSFVYGQGISLLLTREGTPEGPFLACICVCVGIEALAGYRYPDEKNGPRFRHFVEAYFPQPYQAQAAKLWLFRNSLVHAFNPGQDFEVTSQQPDRHFQPRPDGRTILNVEDFHLALLRAAEVYFQDLQSNDAAQEMFRKHANDAKHGGLLRMGFFS